MKEAQQVQDPETVLQECINGVPAENLLAMINSSIHLQKPATVDWKLVCHHVQQWASGDTTEQFNAKDLKKFYKDMLKLIPDGDRYFIVDKIQTVKAKEDELMVLVDWKYFPPSDPHKTSNWTAIGLVDCDQIYSYLQVQENRVTFQLEIQKLPRPYQVKLEWYLDMNLLKQTVTRTQAVGGAVSIGPSVEIDEEEKKKVKMQLEQLAKENEELMQKNEQLKQENVNHQEKIKFQQNQLSNLVNLLKEQEQKVKDIYLDYENLQNQLDQLVNEQ